jgi:hypothetical protein
MHRADFRVGGRVGGCGGSGPGAGGPCCAPTGGMPAASDGVGPPADVEPQQRTVGGELSTLEQLFLSLGLEGLCEALQSGPRAPITLADVASWFDEGGYGGCARQLREAGVESYDHREAILAELMRARRQGSLKPLPATKELKGGVFATELPDGEVRHFAAWGGDDEACIETDGGGDGVDAIDVGDGDGGEDEGEGVGGGGGDAARGGGEDAGSGLTAEDERFARAANAQSARRRLEGERSRLFGDLIVLFRVAPRTAPAALALPPLLNASAPLLVIGPWRECVPKGDADAPPAMAPPSPHPAGSSLALLDAMASCTLPAIQRRHAWLEAQRWPGTEADSYRRVVWLTFGEGGGGEGGGEGGGGGGDGSCGGNGDDSDGAAEAAEVVRLLTALAPTLVVERLRLSPSQPPPLDDEVGLLEAAAAVVVDFRRCNDGAQDIAAARSHIAIVQLRRWHALRGLPLVATGDAGQLLCGGRTGVASLEVRAMRSAVDVEEARRPPPPPICDVEPHARYEAPPDSQDHGGHGFHDAIVCRWRKVDILARAPPLRFPDARPAAPGWSSLLRVCASGRSPCMALLPGAVLVVSNGAPLARHCHECIPLQPTYAAKALAVDGELRRLEAEWVAFERRLANTMAEYADGGRMRQFVDGRRHWLFELTVPELRRWVLTSGRSFFEGNGLHVEERLLASEARVRRLCEMQAELASLRAELRMGM